MPKTALTVFISCGTRLLPYRYAVTNPHSYTMETVSKLPFREQTLYLIDIFSVFAAILFIKKIGGGGLTFFEYFVIL
jgi:hypothetical protein